MATVENLSEANTAYLTATEQARVAVNALVDQTGLLSYLNKITPFGMTIQILLLVLGFFYVSFTTWGTSITDYKTILVWTTVALLCIIFILITIILVVKSGRESTGGASELINFTVFLLLVGSIAALAIMLPKNYVSIWYSYFSLIPAIFLGFLIGYNLATPLKLYTEVTEFINVNTSFNFNMFFIASFFLLVVASIVSFVPNASNFTKTVTSITTLALTGVVVSLIIYFRGNREPIGTNTVL